MFAIAANVCRERRRSAWRRSRVEVVSDDGLVGERAAPEHSHEELAGVADALAELTQNQRRAISCVSGRDFLPRDRGRALATEGAVETLLFRARRSLANKLNRSRGRIRGLSNLGSVLAWGKTLLGGTAAQVAAATLVVAAGMTAASPFQPVPGGRTGHACGVGAATRRSRLLGRAAGTPGTSPRASARTTPGCRRRTEDDTGTKPVAAPVTATEPAPPPGPRRWPTPLLLRQPRR